MPGRYFAILDDRIEDMHGAKIEIFEALNCIRIKN